LFAHVCHAYDFPGITSRHKNVDVIIIRCAPARPTPQPARRVVVLTRAAPSSRPCVRSENTEGEYAGLEHEVVPGVVESIKVITEAKSRRIARYAFEYALLNNRKTVTCVHKANIMKLTDGLFLAVCGEVAKEFPTINYNQIIVDNACMQMASKPQQFDVLLTPNLYGNIIDNIGAGLTGGAGFLPGGSIGAAAAVFEQGASAGNVGITTAGSAGKGSANPVAVMLASAMMLKHLKLPTFALWLEDAVYAVLGAGKVRTPDMGGSNTTAEFTRAVVDYIAVLRQTDQERHH
jgi:isocitrate dehydrogenase (NAD+)